ncbi:MAG TPA: methionyl-tRNA formyltransferase [Candidatus Saccharibacteria bacterium]|nr:methionyl-tRNA formyltransferase [Candidatus Saccharibacteria bacterium]
MIKTSEKIVFFGSGPVATASLDYISNFFEIEAVITKTNPTHHKHTAPVEEFAKKNKNEIFFVNNKNELDDLVQEKNFKSKIGIIVDFGIIVSQKTIDSFPLGIINSHFSLLPQWRGADPITFSILSGQEKTGVSIMLIEPELDTGKLIKQKSLHIDSKETIISLTNKLINLSNELLVEYLPKYLNGEVKPRQQPHPNRATYSRKLTKDDGIIDWKKPADLLEREIRAYIGWPKSRANLLGVEIIITSSHVTENPEDKLDVLCGDKKYLSIDELIAPSGRKMQALDFINGYLANKNI